jgi:hypothetical protein
VPRTVLPVTLITLEHQLLTTLVCTVCLVGVDTVIFIVMPTVTILCGPAERTAACDRTRSKTRLSLFQNDSTTTFILVPTATTLPLKTIDTGYYNTTTTASGPGVRGVGARVTQGPHTGTCDGQQVSLCSGVIVVVG